SLAKLTDGGEVSIWTLRSVFAVDAHVFRTQVARPDGGSPATRGAERDIDPDLGSLKMLLGLRRRIVMRQAVFEEEDATDVDGGVVHVEMDAGSAGRGDDAAPVRIAAMDRRLHERRVGNRLRDALGIVN